jgi:glycosyltransferase involved in cell wall biosynthesis
MIIGIDASRAFFKKRTGIEEYSFQVIKHLRNKLKDAEVVLYLRPESLSPEKCGLKLPKNWKVKVIRWPRLWTQVGLSLELLLHPVDTLFVPAHIVPCCHVKKSVVVAHGLEYEFIPEAYSRWDKLYMRWSIRKSCRKAKRVIAVSENTKNDLARLYGVSKRKIDVIYEGYEREEIGPKKVSGKISARFKVRNSKFLLFIGRIEFRKNTLGIIKSFEILKKKYKIPHKLVLTGGLGHGYEDIVKKADASEYKNDIVLTGYVDNGDKWKLLKNADVFLFPTFYEGFGLPILEAQSLGVPIVVSDNSSVPEVVGRYMRPLLMDPNNYEKIANFTYKIISDKELRNNIKKAGYENIKRFSWDLCAEKIAKILLKK